MMCLKRALGSALVLMLLGACGAPAASDSAAALPTAYVVPPPTSGPVRIAPPSAQPSTPLLPTPEPTVSIPSPSATATATVAPPTPSLSAATDRAALEAQLVAAINEVRTENGLPPYLANAELSAAAHAHSCDLAAHTMISHTSSDGRTLRDRLAASNPPWQRMSESIAAGFDDPTAIVALWMDEPPEGPHRHNILDTDLREVGTGYCYAAEDATGNHHYWTADFALRGS